MKEVLGSSISAFTERFGDSVIEFQQLIGEIFTNEENYREDNGNVILISKSGSEIPFENFKKYIQDIVNGKSVFDLQNKFPSVLKGGTVLREKIIELLSNPNDSDEEDSEDSYYENIDNAFNIFQKRFILPNCNSMSDCDYGAIITNFNKIIPNDKELKFDPKNVKVLERSRGMVTKNGKRGFRDVIHVLLGNGKRTLFYSSSGSNEEKTGKKEGEWFIIPGVASNFWFFKTDGTVKLTKGGNQYLTDMAEYLKINGVESLE
jgi:hypothetical protein